MSETLYSILLEDYKKWLDSCTTQLSVRCGMIGRQTCAELRRSTIRGALDCLLHVRTVQRLLKKQSGTQKWQKKLLNQGQCWEVLLTSALARLGCDKEELAAAVMDGKLKSEEAIKYGS